MLVLLVLVVLVVLVALSFVRRLLAGRRLVGRLGRRRRRPRSSCGSRCGRCRSGPKGGRRAHERLRVPRLGQLVLRVERQIERRSFLCIV